MASLYVTHALRPDSKCIRILTVHAIPEDGSDSLEDDYPIKSSLGIIDLDSPSIEFSALSYVWGTFGATPDFIKCDDVSVKVTSNCFSALKNLRRKLGSYRIWVDAICIDQDNVAEKEQQIPLMGLIYSSAETVYAWLGEGTQKTDRAMRYMAADRLSDYLSKGKDGTTVRRHWAAAWSVLSARWSKIRHPIPFEG